MTAPFRILLLDTKGSNPNHYICLALEHALRAAPNVEIVIKADLHNAISEAARGQCNLFFAFDGEELNRTICARLAAVCGRSVLWVTEDPYEIQVNVANADLFDLVFTNDSASAAAYGNKGRHLPLAGARPFHLLDLPANASAFRYDTFFAGTAWPNRVELLKQLVETDWGGKAIRAKIALPTNEHLPPLNIAMPRSQIDWRTSPLDFARFANLSLTTLVLPRVFSASGDREFAETPPPRLFEAALAGTVQLVQSKLGEAAQYFAAGEDFLYFDGVEDLVEAIHDLRTEPDRRNEIALRAQKKAIALHCYEQRVATVLDEVERLDSSLASTSDVYTVEKPRLMFVVHNVVKHGHFGGVEVYLDHLKKVLGRDFEVFFYVPAGLGPSTAALLVDDQEHVLERVEFSTPASPWQLSCSERETAFAEILRKHRISAVHFHHLLGHVPALVEIARAMGVGTAMTFHDYYAICHNFTLLSFKGRYCHPDDISLSQCDVCLWNGHHVLPGGQATRRAFWDRVLFATDALVFNTQGAADLAARIYPSVANHPRVSILPVPTIATTAGRVPSITQSNEPLKVAVLGNFSSHKGGSVIARTIPLLTHTNVEFHIFGRVEGEYAWLADPQAFPSVHVHGGYQAGTLPQALATCHVSLHLSIWPETYCLTLSEAWDCGLVPIVSNIGALGERVTDGINGIKIPPDSEGALVDAIYRLLENRSLIDQMRGHISKAPIARLAPHLEGLNALYQPIIFVSRNMRRDGQQASHLSLAKMHRPLNSQFWAARPAIVPTTHVPTLRQRILGLARRAMLHYKMHGMGSTAKACVRYIVKRI